MRMPRIVHPGYPHHIILRGNNRRRLFSYPTEYRSFIWFVANATRHYPVVVHNLCLMSNHVHIIATPDERDALSDWVKSFAQRYAQTRNQKRDASGKLFEQRFRSRPILTESYLACATAYVELNPIRAGLKQRLIDYPWSTYRLQSEAVARTEIPPSLWTPSPWYLSLGAHFWERARAFAAWLQHYAGQGGEGLADDHLREFEAADAVSAPCTRRLERPNRRRAQ